MLLIISGLLMVMALLLIRTLRQRNEIDMLSNIINTLGNRPMFNPCKEHVEEYGTEVLDQIKAGNLVVMPMSEFLSMVDDSSDSEVAELEKMFNMSSYEEEK
jgi:hypothetical protein